jgi:hypothetical protein
MNTLSKPIRLTAVFLFFTLCAEIITPAVLSARMDIGRNQQEHGGSPNPASELVDPFTGQFRYSIPVVDLPGPNGSGYSMSLNYTSGVKPDDEASWVGLGWELSPGAINRQIRGVADDIDNDGVDYYSSSKIETNKTFSADPMPSLEVLENRTANDIGGAQNGLTIQPNVGVRYNNYRGWSLGISGGIGYNLTKDLKVNAGFSYEPNTRTSFSLSVSPKSDIAIKDRDFWQQQYQKGLSLGYSIFAEPRSVSPLASEYVSNVASLGPGHHQLFKVFQMGVSADLMFTHSTVDYNKDSDKRKNIVGYLYPDKFFKKDIMDYSVEKQKSLIYSGDYESQLPIPYTSPDLFSVSANGLGGTFRAYHNKSIQCTPYAVSSNGFIEAVGAQGQYSKTKEEYGIGARVNVGLHFNKLNTGFDKDNDKRPGYRVDWVDEDNKEAISDQPYKTVFRFINDKGGELSPGYGTIDNKFVNWNRGITGNSSIIPIKKLNRLSGFDVINTSGLKYNFRLPVFTSSEERHNVGLYEVNNYSVNKNRMAYINSQNDFVYTDQVFYNGSRVNYSNKVATSFLLTSITTPDYIDNTGNGLTADDFGGYTKFGYHKATNSSSKKTTEVKWRSPYKGFYYSKGNLTDHRDDYASVQFGTRESYYLDSVETKTHIAYFATNKSNSLVHKVIRLAPYNYIRRYDCLSAQDENLARKSSEFGGRYNHAEYLDNIRIYAKDSSGTPSHLIKIVRFEYDWSLMTSSPNAESGKGKLTLKKVWFEYNGISNATISPYEFSYAYPTISTMPGSNGLPDRYKGFYQEYAGLNGGLENSPQNPNYNPNNIDRWGYYDNLAESRFDKFITWNYQGTNPTVTGSVPPFDPAAWNLKCITLPTGGQLHIQYEQNDYCYVQDRKAMVFCGVTSNTANEYQLNLDEIDITPSQISMYHKLLKEQFVTGGEKIRFRFKIDLFEDKPGGEEILNGYCCVKDVVLVNNTITIKLDDSNDDLLPQKAAKDFRASHNLEPTNFTPESGEEMLDKIDAIKTAQIANVSVVTTESSSFLRVPVWSAKKGGGIRVKRVLSFNPGENTLDTDDQALYGTEYIYQTLDKNGELISSGVATNEPFVCREENALVKLVDDGAGKYNKHVVAGNMLSQCEGPLGEELLPAPSIGYSKVTMVNINPNISVGGYSVNEYMTVKDDSCQSVVATEIHKDIDYPSIFDVVNGISSAVGVGVNILDVGIHGRYSFTVRNRHGLLRSITRFRGNTSRENFKSDLNNQPVAVSSVRYEYFSDGAPVLVFHDFDRPFRYEFPGTETERVKEHTSTVDQTYTAGPEFTLAVWKLKEQTTTPPPPQLDFGFGVSASVNYQSVESSITNTITRNPVFLKSISSSQDGITHITENIAFDPVSGEAVVTKTSDSYDQAKIPSSLFTTLSPHDGSYYSFTVPLTSVYRDLGKKSESENIDILVNTEDPAFSKTMVLFPNTNNQTLRLSSSGPAGSGNFNEMRGKLYQLYNQFTIGDIIKVSGVSGANSSSALLRVKTIPSFPASPSINIDLGVELLGSTPPPSTIQRISIERSYRQNTIGGTAQTVTVYGADNEIRQSRDFAQMLYDRQQIVDKINAYVFLSHEHKYKAFLKDEHPFTWKPANPSLSNPAFDAVSTKRNYNCLGVATIYNGNILCTDDKKILHDYFCVELKNNEVILEQIWRKPCPNPICNTCDDIMTNPGTNGALLKVALQYTGSELFHVNDNGELIYGSYLNPHTSARSNTLHWDFRGFTCTCTDPNAQTYSDGFAYGQVTPKINAFQPSLLNKVVSASAMVMSNQPDNDYNYPIEGLATGSSPEREFLERRNKGYKSYSYRNTITQSDKPIAGDKGVYKGGIISSNASSFALFDHKSWTKTTSPANWIGSGNVEQYSINGYPLQMVDPLGIRSSKRTGYAGKLVACEGTNATIEEIYFQSFEKTGISIDITNGTALTLDILNSHTGKRSLKMIAGSSGTINTKCTPPSGGSAKPFVIRYWSKGQTSGCTLSLQIGTTISALDPIEILQSGEWKLYEANTTITPSGEELKLATSKTDAGSWFIDDIKIQPLESSVTAYVYEQTTLRPIATFGDDHTALLNQYDMEGKLIRSIAETKIGNYTLSEVTANIGRKIPRTVIETPPYNPGGGGSTMIQPNINNSGYRKRESSIRPDEPLRTSSPLGGTGPMNMFELKLTPEKQKLKVMGADIDSAKKALKDIREKVKSIELPKKDSIIGINGKQLHIQDETNKLKQEYQNVQQRTTKLIDSAKQTKIRIDSMRSLKQIKK